MSHDPQSPAADKDSTPAPRQLPGHIAAALAGAGGAVDSAGQPWAGRDLSGDAAKIHNFEDDDGTADAGYLAAVAALLAGTGSEAGVVASLATARVFVPVVAQLAEEAEGVDGLHADKQADMALVTLKAPDGRTAMPVFTSAGALEVLAPAGPSRRSLRGPGSAVGCLGGSPAARARPRFRCDLRCATARHVVAGAAT